MMNRHHDQTRTEDNTFLGQRLSSAASPATTDWHSSHPDAFMLPIREAQLGVRDLCAIKGYPQHFSVPLYFASQKTSVFDSGSGDLQPANVFLFGGVYGGPGILIINLLASRRLILQAATRQWKEHYTTLAGSQIMCLTLKSKDNCEIVLLAFTDESSFNYFIAAFTHLGHVAEQLEGARSDGMMVLGQPCSLAEHMPITEDVLAFPELNDCLEWIGVQPNVLSFSDAKYYLESRLGILDDVVRSDMGGPDDDKSKQEVSTSQLLDQAMRAELPESPSNWYSRTLSSFWAEPPDGHSSGLGMEQTAAKFEAPVEATEVNVMPRELTDPAARQQRYMIDHGQQSDKVRTSSSMHDQRHHSCPQDWSLHETAGMDSEHDQTSFNKNERGISSSRQVVEVSGYPGTIVHISFTTNSSHGQTKKVINHASRPAEPSSHNVQ